MILPGFARHWETSEALRVALRERTDTVLLAFSCGKDSIVSWLALREHGFTVIPYHLALVPDLEFVEEGIRYFEAWFGCPVHRLLHPSFSRQLRDFNFQPPRRTLSIYDLQLPHVDYADTYEHLRREHGKGLPIVTGVRAADSPMRRSTIKRTGAWNPTLGTAAASFDWSTKAVYQRIADEGIGLPVDYELFGRSFDGIDWRFLAPLRERFPRDYDRILEWFPLADLELFRRELCPTPAT
jgi:hypothetical protein